MEVLNRECKRYGLKINIAKTEVMGLSKRVGQLPVKVSLEKRELNQVESFKYLGWCVRTENVIQT